MELFVRDVFRMVPFSFYVLGSCTQIITITLYDEFDNQNFTLESIELLLNNDRLQFRQALLKVKTALHGVRWLMQSWFLTVAVVVVMTIAIVLSTCAFLAFLFVKKINLI